VRHELLERELNKLGIRKSGQLARESGVGQQQGGSGHPVAGDNDSGEHGD
jgi:hypothetical protein